MLTSHDNDSDIFASLSAGAGGYCLKDVLPERLYTAIRSVNAGDIWLDSSIASRVVRLYNSSGFAAGGSKAAANSASESPDTSAHHDAPRAAAHSTHSFSNLPSLPEPLSPRELEVLGLLVDGLSNQEIADKLIISLATAKTHVRNILNKLAVDDRTQAAVQAMRRGLV
ncbi:MAG: response regulator transcription factor [Candidatus Obscuribacter sp.]|nr:response regulator transcription factor [Candidatus Obscuribacter sp.]